MSLKDEEIFVDCSIIKEEYSLSQPELTIETTSANSFESTETTHFVIKEVIKEEEKKTTNFQCNICLIYFITKQCLVRHYEWAHAKDPIPCNICKRTLKNYRTLCKHLKVHDKMRIRYKCDQCEKTLATKYRLKCHIGIVHNKATPPKDLQPKIPEKFNCRKCRRIYRGRDNIKRHLLMHKKENDVNCPECRKVFKNAKYLEKHMDFHRKLKPFMCNTCGIPFARRELLTKHITRHKDKAIICPHCKNVYKNSLSFKCHMRDMHKGIPFNASARSLSCTICKENCGNLDNLREHVKIHYSTNTFECGHCGKIFKRKTNMRQHILKVHRGESKKRKYEFNVPDETYKYSCPYCYKGFNAKTNYLTHLTVHTNERRFKCGSCEAKFKTKQHLQKHEMLKHFFENNSKRDESVEPEQQQAEFPVNPATIKTEIDDNEYFESQIEVSDYIKTEEDASIVVKTEEILR